MTWTYDNNPAGSDLSEVRYLVGDTDSTDELVSDEEIAYAVASEANNTMAAVRTARAIASKFARLVTKAVGDLKINYSDRVKHYMDLATFLEDSDPAANIPVPYAGGISVSDKDSVEENTDRVNPAFERGQFDNPEDSDESRNIYRR